MSPRQYDPGLQFFCTESGGTLTWVSDSDGSTADVKVTTGCDLNANPPVRYAFYDKKYAGTSVFGVRVKTVGPEPIPAGFDCTDYAGTLKPWAINAYSATP